MLVLSRMSLLWMVLCSVATITPVTFYTQLFKPCYDCYDFESAATHEIGHLLGLNPVSYTHLTLPTTAIV